jgi:isopentenyl-diphosphate delta-isomerase
MAEYVVLLDEHGQVSGHQDKATVHNESTPLHLAFSCHVFDRHGQVLLTRRALTKTTWPGAWTNSVCGHPGPGEPMEDAVRRRARFELGTELADVTTMLPGFRYRAVDAGGMVENEICPVFRATAVGSVRANRDEVSEWQWARPADVARAVTSAPFVFSPWFVAQVAAGIYSAHLPAAALGGPRDDPW